MKIIPRRLFAVTTIAALSLAATACGGDDDGITLYSGRSESLIQPIIDDFTDASGIDVNIKYGDTAELALLIEEESNADRVEADVYISQSPGAMGFIDSELAPIQRVEGTPRRSPTPK